MGSTWLGRDALTDDAVAPPTLPGLDHERWRELTAEARGYGFHATLKPPFFLAEGVSASDLVAATTDFAAHRQPFDLPALGLAAIGGFLALVPGARSGELHALADAGVSTFDRFRRPASQTELARRRQAALSPRQLELLVRWGYPYVFDEYRFHLTLTRRLAAEERAAMAELLAPLVEPVLREPVAVVAVWLFEQPATGEAFRAVFRCPFAV